MGAGASRGLQSRPGVSGSWRRWVRFPHASANQSFCSLTLRRIRIYHTYDMKRTTIFADEELLSEIREISAKEKKSVAEVMREAMENHVRKKRLKRKLSFLAIGRSGRKDIAERHEELLWKKDKQ